MGTLGNLALGQGQQDFNTWNAQNNWDYQNRGLDANIYNNMDQNAINAWLGGGNVNNGFINANANMFNVQGRAEGQPMDSNPMGAGLGGLLGMLQLLNMGG